ncbi:hypothetical protein B0J13DRAFT_650031, partial [Dactylonectria estremocensis]
MPSHPPLGIPVKASRGKGRKGDLQHLAGLVAGLLISPQPVAHTRDPTSWVMAHSKSTYKGRRGLSPCSHASFVLCGPATHIHQDGFPRFSVPEHIFVWVLAVRYESHSKSPTKASKPKPPLVQTQCTWAGPRDGIDASLEELGVDGRRLSQCRPIPVLRAMPPGPLSPSTSSLAERRHHGMPQWALSSFPCPPGRP